MHTVRYFAVLVILFMYVCINGQSSSAKIVVGIEFSESIEDSDKTVIDMYYNRLQRGLTMNGIGSNAASTFFIRATYNRGASHYTSSAPVRLVREYFFELQLINRHGAEVFASYSTTQKVAGRSEKETLKSAVTKLDFEHDRAFIDFIERAKQKILDYYKLNCENIIQEAERLTTKKSYLAAISKLMSIPDGHAPCDSRSAKVLSEVFNEYEQYTCTKNLQKARSLVANREFNKATLVLIGSMPVPECQESIHSVIDELKANRNYIDSFNFKKMKFLHRAEVTKEVARYRFKEVMAQINAKQRVYYVNSKTNVISSIFGD